MTIKDNLMKIMIIKLNRKMLIILSVFLMLVIFMGNVSAIDGNATVSIGEVVNQDNNNEILTVEESSNGIESSCLGEFEDGNLLKAEKEDNILKDSVNVEGNTFDDIQKAIDIANPGDTIYLEGLYTGLKTITVNKDNLTFMSKNDAILDAQRLTSILNIPANGVTLKNIEFINAINAITCSGKNCTIINSIFENNAADNGGGIYWTGAYGKIINSIFINNTATDDGGSIYWRGMNGAVINSTFIDNSAVEYGGSIFWGGDNGAVVNSNFTGNSARKYGGGIFWYGDNGAVVNSTLSDNLAFEDAGGIFWQCLNGVVANSTFLNNNAIRYGGGIVWFDKKGTVVNSTFINNGALAGGGILWYQTNGAVVNSTFKNNYANSNGGGVYWAGNSGDLINSTFVNNSALSYGGGVYWAGNSGDLINSTFIDNHVLDKGGGVCWNGDNGNILNSNFTRNHAEVLGGGVAYLTNGCVAYSNFLSNDAHQGGGAFLAYDVTIKNSIFSNNHAWYGGAGVLANNKVTVKDSIFENNSASNYGGGISAINSILDNVTVNNNSANVGGGAYLYDSTIKNSKFYNNKANNGSEVYYLNKILLLNNQIDGGITRLNTYVTGINSSHVIVNNQQYWVFCLELKGYDTTYGFLDDSMQQVINKINKKSVSEYLKILTYIYINSSNFNKNVFSDYVWTFSDKEYWNSNDPIVKNIISLYDSGFRVPSVNATKLLPNGTLIVFNFSSVVTPSYTQNFFLFRFDYCNDTNLSVDKKVLNKTVFVGDEFKYVITVYNSGNQTLDDVYVEDNDYTGNIRFIRFVNGTGNWTYSNETITVTDSNSNYRNLSSRWILNTPLKPGENKTIILIFKALKNGKVINNVTSGFKQIELSKSTEENIIYNPNMTVKKITLTPVVVEGSLTTFMILVSNTGDYDLNDIYIVESDYAGLIYDSYKGVNWIKSGDKFMYDGVLHVGETVGFNITFKTVHEGNFTNIVVAGSNETDNKTTNNTTEALKPGLEVYKITLNKKVLVGEKVTFEIQVKNTGHTNLTEVFVEETEYNGLVYDSYNGINWFKSDDKFSYYGVLHVGETVGFNITFKTVREGNFTNVVMAGSNETDNKTTNNTTEVIKKPTFEDNHTSENKTTKLNKTKLVDKTKEIIENNSVPKIKNPKDNIIFDKKATGNPLLVLALAILIIPIRRFKK